MGRKILLGCGIGSSVLYLVTLFVGQFAWHGYSSFSQTVSEFIAIGAPTRDMIVFLWVLYDLLIFLFAVGVWKSAEGKWIIRIVALGLAAKEILGLIVTLFFPIHLRGVAGTFTDVMHGILTMAGVLCYLIAMGCAAAAFGRGFRIYTIATMILLPVFGFLAGQDAPRLAPNLPTPWMGVWERINIVATMIWIMVLAIVLLRTTQEDKVKTQANEREADQHSLDKQEEEAYRPA